MKVPKSMPELIPVKDSSNVLGIGYDPNTKMLYVQFMPSKDKKLTLYRYAKVSEGVFERFAKSPSKGVFVWTHLKDKFGYARWSGSGWVKETALKRRSAQRKKQKKMAAAN